MEAEEKTRIEAEEKFKIKADAEYKANLEVEAKVKAVDENRTRIEADAKAKVEAEDKARLKVEEKASRKDVINIKVTENVEVRKIENSTTVKSESTVQSVSLEEFDKQKTSNETETVSDKLTRQDSIFHTEIEEETNKHFIACKIASSSHEHQQENVRTKSEAVSQVSSSQQVLSQQETTSVLTTSGTSSGIGQISENLDISTDKLLTVSADDSYHSNSAISTKSSLKQDESFTENNATIQDEHVKKLVIDKSVADYLRWIKKTRKEINKVWTKYKKQSTMELRQEIIHLTKRIQQRIDDFSDSSDETLIEEQNTLETQVSNIKYEILRHDEKCLDEIAIMLQHSDALITSYELDSSIFSSSDLMKLATMLDEAHGKLNDLNQDDLNQNEAFISKFNSLKSLYINLVTRLQKLQQPCDHIAQVNYILKSISF